jgi:hypothetical protein
MQRFLPLTVLGWRDMVHGQKELVIAIRIRRRKGTLSLQFDFSSTNNDSNSPLAYACRSNGCAMTRLKLHLSFDTEFYPRRSVCV